MIRFLNKFKLTIIMLVFITVSVILFISFKSFIYPEDSKSVYGDRLEGIENVTITDDKLNEVITKTTALETIESCRIDIYGKIVNIVAVSNLKGTEVKVKEVFNTVLEEFDDDVKAYYDFQFFASNEVLKYSLIGYKNKTTEEPVYTVSYEVDEDEEEN